jgi:hypothetical protein
MTTGDIAVHEEVNIIGAGRRQLSDVAWGAVLAGGLAATTVTIVLMILGSGLGLMVVSPWDNRGIEAGTLGIAAVAWIIFIQWASAALGGYMAGRLRHRSTYTTGDETLFRDTGHGFLAWAVGTMAVALTVSFFAYAVASGANRMTSAAIAGAAQGAAASKDDGAQENPTAWLDYYTDVMFRDNFGLVTAAPADAGTAQAGATQPGANPGTAPTPALPTTPRASSADAGTIDTETRGEITRIFVRGLRGGDVAAADRTYLAQVVSQRTGLGLPEAQQRVDAVIADIKSAEAKVRETADKARAASAKLALFIALSMAIGAFIAAVMGAVGGRLRDEPNTD